MFVLVGAFSHFRKRHWMKVRSLYIFENRYSKLRVEVYNIVILVTQDDL